MAGAGRVAHKASGHAERPEGIACVLKSMKPHEFKDALDISNLAKIVSRKAPGTPREPSMAGAGRITHTRPEGVQSAWKGSNVST